MICPSCRSDNSAETDHCLNCGKAFHVLVRGEVLSGRYEILDILGKGGMGVVYKALDRELDEQVAIKVIRAGSEATPQLAKRFRTEIKLARRIRHENVCGLHEYGQDGDRRYIVMELIDGRDYRQILRDKGCLPPDEAYAVAIQVGLGLDAIHRAGIVHRDLKTPNIMRDTRGIVRVMDFGIAKQFDAVASTKATATGHIVGTPEYMSPEQARGELVDPRSDIYALGIVTYELFTGQVPFRGDTPVATLMMHFQTPPPLETSRLPPPLVPVLREALTKAKEERYASVAEMVAALRLAQAQSVPGTVVLPRPMQPGSSPSSSSGETGTLVEGGHERGTVPMAPSGAPPPPASGATPAPRRFTRKSADTKIGILLWNAQVRYQKCRDGVIDQLRDEGFVEPEVAITVEHADAHTERVTELARRFASERTKVLIPIGTSAAVGVAAEVQDIPVVFAFTFDPVASKIAMSWKSSGNNTTGASSKTPAPLLLRWLRTLAPVRRIGVLFTPGERNTEAQLADFQAISGVDLEVIPAPGYSPDDIAPAISRLEGVADALLLTGSSVLGAHAAQIVHLANRARLLTATQSEGLETRVLLGVTVNPTDVGRLAGKKAALVLKGRTPASIEIEALETSDLTVNLGVAKILGIQVPDAVRKQAKRVLGAD